MHLSDVTCRIFVALPCAGGLQLVVEVANRGMTKAGPGMLRMLTEIFIRSLADTSTTVGMMAGPRVSGMDCTVNGIINVTTRGLQSWDMYSASYNEVAAALNLLPGGYFTCTTAPGDLPGADVFPPGDVEFSARNPTSLYGSLVMAIVQVPRIPQLTVNVNGSACKPISSTGAAQH